MNKGSGKLRPKKEGRTTEDRNRLQRSTNKAQEEYLQIICDKFIKLQRLGHYDITYMKKKELGWKQNHGIRNICIEDSQGNIIIDHGLLLKKWENYITEL
jgi:hypothetical protein